MGRAIHAYAYGWTQTLEQSETSASGVFDGREIEVNYPVSNVTGVFDNDAGTGTNYWTVYPDGHPNNKVRAVMMDARKIRLPADSGLAAATACWVTYDVPSTIRPIQGAYGTSGLVGLAEISANGLTYNFTGFSEMTGPETGTPVEVPLEPNTGGLAVKTVKVVTDGTNIDLYVYKASTASYANLIYQLTGINNISIDNSEWNIPVSNTSVWIGYVDGGANATPANTTVDIHGAPLI